MKNLNFFSTEAAMKGMIKLTAMMLSVGLVSAPLMAAGKSTSGAQFLRVGAGARGAAIGGFSPIADDATAIYWNPAGMAALEKREAALSYNSQFEDTAGQFVGYSHPTSKGTWGLGLSLFGVKDIDKRSATGGDADTPDLGSFNTQDMALSLGWAHKRDLRNGLFNYGVAVKYISSNLETASAKTGALDLGAIYNLHQDRLGLSFSLAVLNLGGELKFDNEGDPLPLNIKPGLAYKMGFEKLGTLIVAMDANMLVNDGISIVQPGFEWQAHPMLAIRAGYQSGRGEGAGSGMSAGAGFSFGGISLDYAFVPFGDLGDSHRISLGYKF